MAATVVVNVDWGGTDGSKGTTNTVSTAAGEQLRFKTAEDMTVDTVNPIPIPDTGDNYSFWRHVYIKSTVGPDTNIDNIKFYGDGTVFADDVVLNVGTVTTSTYEVGTGTVGSTGTELTAGHAGISAITSCNTYTTGSPLSVTGDLSGAGSTSKYVVMQMKVGSAASSGTKTAEELNFRFDEI